MALGITVIVPAYNEERNIKNLLTDLLRQDINNRKDIVLKEIVVISCSTDKTNQIVRRISEEHPEVKLIEEEERRGKAAAINLSMRLFRESDIAIVVSADIRLFRNSLNNLIGPLIKDGKIGLATGSAMVYPLSDKKMNFINSFLWELLNQTNKYLSLRNSLAHCFGELYAFRTPLFETLPEDVVNEDQYIASNIRKRGYKVVYVENAKVILRGPSSLRELLTQRARINHGHITAVIKYKVRPTIFSLLVLTKPFDAIKIFVDTMRKFPINNWLYAPLLVLVEIASYFLQVLRSRRFSKLWDPILSTKYEIRGVSNNEYRLYVTA